MASVAVVSVEITTFHTARLELQTNIVALLELGEILRNANLTCCSCVLFEGSSRSSTRATKSLSHSYEDVEEGYLKVIVQVS